MVRIGSGIPGKPLSPGTPRPDGRCWCLRHSTSRRTYWWPSSPSTPAPRDPPPCATVEFDHIQPVVLEQPVPQRRVPRAPGCPAKAVRRADCRAPEASAVVDELDREVELLALDQRWTVCRSSRLLLETRSSSPWICALTPFGPSSRISLDSFFAFSWVIPA